ncbi:tRNA-dependent cyclodipeptide synthase [Coleofasciculus sp. G2-EDA-02]|uniref:tRNA-dependent cyclodipeptide synthase n=1 Tax=unclassified Coleofasciculus TaxID=2692782 RepID=UPI0032F412BF
MNSHRDEEKIIENFDWNQLSLERLKLIQSKIGKAIYIKKKCLNLTNSTEKMSQIHGYKASLAKVFPSRLRSSLSEYKQCVFGISLGSKNFVDPKRIEACIKWISENFPACLVLVCDSIYRLTIEVRQGVKGDEARLEAIRTGEQFIDENSYLFNQYSGRCKFEFQKTSQIENQSDFEMYYQELHCLYQKDQSFQNMVNSFAQKYLNRGEQVEAGNRQDDYNSEKMYLGTTYLLEESALLTCLVKQGWSVFVYPGSIKTFEEIVEGLYPEVPEPLKQMVWVSLRLKQWTAKSGHETQ